MPGKIRVLLCPQIGCKFKPGHFPDFFLEADEIVFIPSGHNFDQAGDAPYDIADFYASFRSKNVTPARLFMTRNLLEAWEHVANSEAEGDRIVSVGAGEAPQCKPARRKIWIGHGSNTWKSDLNLNVEYVKTQGPAARAGASIGIPWMAGIPGTIGGWIKMNAGAFGRSISEVVEAVKVDGIWIPAEKCGFSYRHSDITGEIQDVKWSKEAIFAEKKRFTAEEFLSRRKVFPPGTYGSFFKNPEGDFAGRLLEEVGAKALRVGGAYVWEEHANVIVRAKGATASDVLALARLMYRRVCSRFGVSLEPEVQGINFD
jgi:UDP-N-acetylenolpyruvoylglucosamine reductase